MGISKLNPSAGGIPFGNTAGRPTAATGKLYSNGETARLELYTSAGQWENIVQEVPGVSSIGGQYLETNNSNTITIYGTNFVSGASAFAIGTNAVEVAATSTTFNSLVQLTAVFTGLTAANEPYDIKVVNPSNLFGILPDCLFVNNQVTWTTSAGSLGSFGDAVAISVSATASDDSTITYAVASGSSLPSGITLNTATGLISGTLPDVASNTTYTFTLTASDGSNPAVSRQFSFTSNAAPVWTTSAGSLGSFAEQSAINITVAATDPSDTVTYALNSGSSLPSGITLNTSTGVISGTLPNIETDTEYSFVINASDGVNTVSRSFSITSQPAVASIEALVVAGGGGGGGDVGGGGGAGGIIYHASFAITLGTPYTVTVGAGGLGGSQAISPFESRGQNGTDSYFGSMRAFGGGRGGFWMSGTAPSGGSGGGASGTNASTGGSSTQTSNNGGTGYGNVGGNSTGNANYFTAGGGGAGAAGSQNNGTSKGGAGGIGLQTWSTWASATSSGHSGYFGGGGGGGGGADGGSPGTGGDGGTGGGGAGWHRANGSGSNGLENTGGGGGGTGGGGSTGGTGGSGIVILRYVSTFADPSSVTNGTKYTSGGYKYYKFTSTGSVTF